MAEPEESSPFLPKKEEPQGTNGGKCSKAAAFSPSPERKASTAVPMGWTAEGVPVGHGVMDGEPEARRAEWDSGLCACLGRNDELCSSDLEVCLLGSVAPCVLYGSNVERIGSPPASFSNHCLPYAGLYVIGSLCFGWNCLAPFFAYHTRTAIRRKFNLEGSCEGLARSFGWSDVWAQDEMKHERCESACDLVTHVFCHVCALCQEAREVRRRLPHPGFNAQPILVMLPPVEQTMGR
ncbi:unnamed protein product [Cuscuta campestris]|uniref:Uncharacterized protein n=1 Tax=Cuscuta campestris TaxID=132261 RepID=A0A484NM24_9ASTE|nr:unnamed protein product [Cuscuta campestris]